MTWKLFISTAIFCACVLLFTTDIFHALETKQVDENANAKNSFEPPEIPAPRLSLFQPVDCREHHECRPLNMPTPAYPLIGIMQRIEASCEVRFLVDENGRAKDITPECTDERFVQSAKDWASKLDFVIQNDCGQPCSYTQRPSVYPIEFRLEE